MGGLVHVSHVEVPDTMDASHVDLLPRKLADLADSSSHVAMSNLWARFARVKVMGELIGGAIGRGVTSEVVLREPNKPSTKTTCSRSYYMTSRHPSAHSSATTSRTWRRTGCRT